MKLGAVGDVVNVAARVQSLTPQCGFGVLLTGATYDRLNGTVTAVPCGKFPIKGREQTIEVWGVGKTLIDTDCGDEKTLVLKPIMAVEPIQLTGKAVR
jgi:class 3 adenylate cyclase